MHHSARITLPDELALFNSPTRNDRVERTAPARLHCWQARCSAWATNRSGFEVWLVLERGLGHAEPWRPVALISDSMTNANGVWQLTSRAMAKLNDERQRLGGISEIEGRELVGRANRQQRSGTQDRGRGNLQAAALPVRVQCPLHSQAPSLIDSDVVAKYVDRLKSGGWVGDLR